MPRRSPGEGSVQIRSDGRWQGALQINGRRRTVYGTTRSEVTRKLGELKQQARGGNLPSSGNKTVNDLLDAWLSAVSPTLKARTVADYTVICKRYIRPDIGSVRLSKLSPQLVQGLYSRLQGTGNTRVPSHAHAVLHRACEVAVLWGWIGENPCERTLRPGYRPGRKEVWSLDELGCFLDGTRESWLHPLWVMAVATGCRLGELLALKWEDVDLAMGTVNIRRNVQRINRKRVFSEPKTRAGGRTIMLPAEAVSALRWQKAQQAAWRLKAGSSWQDAGGLFTGLGGNVMDHSTAEQATRRVVERLGLPKLTPHGLRHLAASLLLAKGLPVPVVSARLGHASPSITMSIYAHALQHQDRLAADAMEELLRSR